MFSLIRKVSVWASAVKLGRVSPSGGDGRAAAFFYKNLLPQALRSKRGAAALAILAAMYAAAIFAPYSPTEQCLDKSFHPPTKIFFENGSLRAQCYRQSDPSIAQYEPVEGESLPIKFFVRDEKSDCKIFGLIPFKARLFGVDSPEPDARVYLLGADSTGRDVFSRLLYGARVSLSIGFAGIAITMVLGFLMGGLAGYFGALSQLIWGRLYRAVPFFGIKSRIMSAPSSRSNFIFFSIPPAYPVRLPFVPTTRWQGIMIEISLRPTAPPAAWADMRASPFRAAISRAISP